MTDSMGILDGRALDFVTSRAVLAQAAMDARILEALTMTSISAHRPKGDEPWDTCSTPSISSPAPG